MWPGRKQSVKLQTIKNPKNVKVLILSESKTSLKEFYLIKGYTNLVKIDLSYNKLASFPQGFSFQPFSKLRTLFLHYNKFPSLKPLAPVAQSKSLLYLTLFGNTLEQAKARHLFINSIPTLMLMDDKIVRVEERNTDITWNRSESKSLEFPLVTSSEEETTQMFLSKVIQQISTVRREYLKANPVIKLQRWWKQQLKKRDRKWKVVDFPSKEMRSQFEEHKGELDRLITEPIQAKRSNQQIISSFLRANIAFWTSLTQIMKRGEIYLSREYCTVNAIQFEQQHKYSFIRPFQFAISLKRKRQLLFFLYYHQQIVLTKRNKQSKISDPNRLHTINKFGINLQKIIRTEQSLSKLDHKFQDYVKPQLSPEKISQIVKKEYYRYIDQINRFENVPAYPILFQQLLIRTKAAITIQRYWKGSKVRKIMDSRIKIRKEKAVRVIQKWVRQLKFRHRYKFLLEVNQYLKDEKSSKEIVLEMRQIPAIQEYCTYKENLGKYFIICFQECTFQIQQGNNIAKQPTVIFNSARKPYPSYLPLCFESCLLTNLQQNLKSNVLAILFQQAQDIQRILDSKGTKYIRFKYSTIQQTLNRKYILALKTYRMSNHQFIKSLPCPQVPISYHCNLVDTINSNKLISIFYDSNTHLSEGSPQQKIRQLQNKRSYSSIHTDAKAIGNVISLKVKFFLASNDYSCHMMLKPPNYGGRSVQRIESSRPEIGPSKKSDIGMADKPSKRYLETDTHPHLISRNIMSLNHLDNSTICDKKSQNFPKILNTDQSHSYLDSLSPKYSQTIHNNPYLPYGPSRTECLKDSVKKMKEIQMQQLKQRRQLIQEVKISHRDRINQIVLKKSEHLNNLKDTVSKQHQENNKLIQQLKEQVEREKKKKRNQIRSHLKHGTNSFQSDFLKKGINSMKKDLRNFQKSRSFRESIAAPVPTQNSTHNPAQKTQLKQFSLHFTEQDGSSLLDSLKAGSNRYANLKSHASHSRSLMSEISEAKIKIESEVQQKEEPKDIVPQKKMKKRRMVHSVFPQEFYPLRQGGKIGFELPKIKN